MLDPRQQRSVDDEKRDQHELYPKDRRRQKRLDVSGRKQQSADEEQDDGHEDDRVYGIHFAQLGTTARRIRSRAPKRHTVGSDRESPAEEQRHDMHADDDA